MTEKIEVEWISTIAGALQAIEKLNSRLDRQEKQLQKIGDTSEKSAKMAAGSFNKLEQELKENEAALKRMTMGTKEFDAQRKKVDALKTSLKGARGELSRLGGGIGESLSAGVAKMGALAAGMLSFQTVVSAVVSELEKVKQLRLDAANTSRTFEQALADLGQNVGADAVPVAKQMIIERAPELGTTQEGLANLMGVAISAGAKDLEEAMALSSASLKLTVGDAAKAIALVGGTLDVASLGGSKNFEGALGQLLQTQSQVRSTNLSEFAANIGPGLAAATAQGQHQQGVSTERALEVASVISQIIKDQTGANTATTMRQFFTRLDSFSPERTKKLDDGGTAKVSKAAIEQFQGAKTFDERLALLRGNEPMMLQFLETQRESIGKTAVREMIAQSPRAVAFEDKAKRNISSIDDAQPFFADLTKVLVAETSTLTAERQGQANIQRHEVTGVRDTEGQVIKLVEDTLDKVNLSGIDFETRKKGQLAFHQEQAAGADVFAAGIAELTAAKEQRKLFGLVPVGDKVESKDVEFIDAQIKVIEKLRAASQLLEKTQQPQVVAARQRPAANQNRVEVSPPAARNVAGVGTRSEQPKKEQQAAATDAAAVKENTAAIRALQATIAASAIVPQVQQPQPVRVVLPPVRPKEAPLPVASVP